MSLKKTSLIFFFILLVNVVSAKTITLTDLKTNYKTNPLGLDVSLVRFSWKLVSDQDNTLQKNYEIRIATSEADLAHGKNLIWTSGRVEDQQSVNVTYKGPSLRAKTRYFWQVRVADNHNVSSGWSKVQFFETAMLGPGDWQADWIELATATAGKVGPAPIFAQQFELSKQVRSARLYITSHGLYEATINGKRVGTAYFTPGWTSYHKRLQYQTYDVTGLLKTGQNATSVTIGDGWYRGNLEFNNKRNLYGKEVALLYQLEVRYNDGSMKIIASNDTWKASLGGPIKKSDIYNGETFDANLVQVMPSLDLSSWEKVKTVAYGKNNLIDPFGPPVTKHEELNPVKIIITPKKETVIDFGQNLVGWVKLSISGAKGDTITLNHAEVLDAAGNFYTENLRNAKQENKYVLTGKGVDVFEPHFTFQGFRYVRISGYKGTISKDQLKAIAIYSDMKPTGSFSSSNELVNQLQHNIQWGQKGNFVDVPTDCPQRDERLGWTGDAQVFFSTAAYNMDVAGFFSKWLADLKADQHPTGNIPVVIPDVRSVNNAGSAGWADVSTIIPWNYYLAYGDKDLLSRQYESMKAWVNYVKGISKDNLWNSGPHYGDWLFYSLNDDRDGKSAITDKFLIAQVFYAASTQNLINAAKVLGHKEDEEKYSALLKDIKGAFLREYVTPSGRLTSNSQTAYVLALHFDMLPVNLREQAAQRLVDNIVLYKNHLTTGFLGTPYLCHVLSRFGHTSTAYKLLLQDTYPSWLYPVKKGATTIWERWDGIKADGTFQAISMNSFNHYAYGAIGDWMYKTIAGINYDADSPGYKHIIIAPKLDNSFTHASGKLETLYGEVISEWKLNNNNLKINVAIPANTRASIILPSSSRSKVKGSPNIQQTLEALSDQDQDITLSVGSGNYSFEYVPTK